VTDERFGSPPTERDRGEGSGPRRVPIYDRRAIRPEDWAVSAQGAQDRGGERPPDGGPTETAAAAAGPATDAAGDGGDMAENAAVLLDDASGEAALQEEVRLANEKASEHLADLQRLQADFANYRKRVLREQTELVERAAGHLVHRLLSVLDSFELAVAAAEETKDFERMLRGVEMVLGELKEVLHIEGLETIPAKDLPFDPNLHEAALEVPGDEDGEMVVAGVLRPGYVLKGRILRPAMVKVTRRRATTGRGEPKEP
jgi:molecular chaperone GrpE